MAHGTMVPERATHVPLCEFGMAPQPQAAMALILMGDWCAAAHHRSRTKRAVDS